MQFSTRYPVLIGIALLLAAAGSAGASEIYKWTDAEGFVHYGDRPAEDVQSERVEIQSRRTDPARIAALTQARAKARNEAREQQRDNEGAGEDEAGSAEEARAAAEERARQCTTYKDRLQTFLQSRRLYREDENGERVYLSEEEMQAARENVQSKVVEYCED